MSDRATNDDARQAARQLTADARYGLLLEIARRSRHTLDLGETLDLLLDTVATVVSYDAAGIFALNEGLYALRERPEGVIAGVAKRGFPARPVADDAMLSAGGGLVGHAIRTGEPLLVPDVARDPRYVVGRPETRSEVVVPIRVEGRTIAALDLESDRLAAFDAGDLEVLAFFAEAAGLAIEKALLHRHLLDLERDKEVRDRQLRIAGEVQGGLLPQAAPTVPGHALAARCLPSLELGGDSYDYLPFADGRLGLVIADVAGKGVPAALIMATFRALLRARQEVEPSPATTAAAVARLLRASAPHRGFVTCIYAVLDPPSGRLVYTSCGHPQGLLQRADGAVEELANCGPALGAFDDADYVDRSVDLAPGDRLLLYTDGLTEATAADGEQLGVGPVLETLAAGRGSAPDALVDALVARARAFAGRSHLGDDLTILVLERGASP